MVSLIVFEEEAHNKGYHKAASNHGGNCQHEPLQAQCVQVVHDGPVVADKGAHAEEEGQYAGHDQAAEKGGSLCLAQKIPNGYSCKHKEKCEHMSGLGEYVLGGWVPERRGQDEKPVQQTMRQAGSRSSFL